MNNPGPAQAVSAMREEFRKQPGVELTSPQAQAAIRIEQTLHNIAPVPK